MVDKKSSRNVTEEKSKVAFWKKLMELFHQIVEELMSPPTLAAVSD